ncbi:MAG TPA: EAL domain-containing protein [Acidimicrobiales bacterium]|nr:EAL domain-containing protein [Acidimicrobiales bacterium]
MVASESSAVRLRPGPALVACAAIAGVAAVIYFFWLASLTPLGGDRTALLPVVAFGSWATFSVQVPVRHRNFIAGVVLSEIPALVAIVFLSPWQGCLAMAAGHCAVRIGKPLTKSASNVLAYLVSFEVGQLVYHAALHGSSPVSPAGWGAGTATVLAVNVVDFVLLSAIWTIAAIGWSPNFRAIAVQDLLAVAISSLGGLVAVQLVWANTWDIALFVIVLVAIGTAFRGALVSAQRYVNLERLYEATRSLGSLRSTDDVVRAVLSSCEALLGTTTVQLVTGGTSYRLCADGALSASAPSPRTAPVPDDSGSALGGHSSGPLVVLLDKDDARAGYLAVEAQREIGRPDRRFLEALAANAWVALRSAHLHEQLALEASERRHQAQHDALTGLPNRALFSESLNAALAVEGQKVAVMLVDLDGFKEVNDTLGHHTGDSILSQVGQRLAPLAERGWLVSRLGGDEFAVLVPQAPDMPVIKDAADDIVNCIAEPIAVDGLLLDVRASLGVAVAPDHCSDSASLVRHADIAMYAAKRTGGGAHFYDRSEDRSTLRRLRLATELRRAIDGGGLDVWYQPVLNLVTGGVVSCEALLRWEHDQFGPIPPSEFIPVAESGGLIDQLTWLVLTKALRQAKAWQEVVPGLHVAVNLSARNLMSVDIAERLSRELDKSGLDAASLTLELTESSADPQGAERALIDLCDLGVNLSIDDYGTGFSSLSRLKQLPFHELKIDRSFVKEMIRDKGDEAIVRSTIELARSLGRTVTAEGVEDGTTFRHLQSLGCDAAQGYFLARPLPPAQCRDWLVSSAR